MNNYNEYNKLSNEEINKRIRHLTTLLESPIDPESWQEYYKEYSTLTAIMNERYKEENQDSFDAFYKEHIEGKKWEEIDPDVLDFYSDWHKDMYGFRPRGTSRG